MKSKLRMLPWIACLSLGFVAITWAQPGPKPLAGINQAASMSYVEAVDGFLVYPFGAIKKGTIWTKPTWTKNGNKPLTVCWVTAGVPSKEIRDVVKDAALSSWAYYGLIDFVGWGNCAGANSPDVRIGISDSMSGTVGLGSQLKGKSPGMMLRVDYSSDPTCRIKDQAEPHSCLRATAIHEFGHIVGLAHEDRRPDAPDWCKEYQKKSDTTGQIPDQTVTVPDLHSIMNYCNPQTMNDGKLSPKDIESVISLYGGRA